MHHNILTHASDDDWIEYCRKLEWNAEQIHQFLGYIRLIEQCPHNLMGACQPEEVWNKHVLDSLSAGPYIQDHQTVADVGSGGGFPGIILAIAYPHVHFTLIDKIGKKASFLNQAIQDHGIKNAHALYGHTSMLHQTFDAVVVRGVGSLKSIIRATRHLLRPDSALYMMKGHYPEQELSQLPSAWKRNCHVDALSVCGYRRHMVVCKHPAYGTMA